MLGQSLNFGPQATTGFLSHYRTKKAQEAQQQESMQQIPQYLQYMQGAGYDQNTIQQFLQYMMGGLRNVQTGALVGGYNPANLLSYLTGRQKGNVYGEYGGAQSYREPQYRDYSG